MLSRKPSQETVHLVNPRIRHWFDGSTAGRRASSLPGASRTSALSSGSLAEDDLIPPAGDLGWGHGKQSIERGVYRNDSHVWKNLSQKYTEIPAICSSNFPEFNVLLGKQQNFKWKWSSSSKNDQGFSTCTAGRAKLFRGCLCSSLWRESTHQGPWVP